MIKDEIQILVRDFDTFVFSYNVPSAIFDRIYTIPCIYGIIRHYHMYLLDLIPILSCTYAIIFCLHFKQLVK
jgi:hypothetical protein